MHPAVSFSRVSRLPGPVDLAIAGAILVWGLVEILLLEGPGGPPLKIASALAWALPLLLRRRFPVGVLVWICGVTILRAAVLDGTYQGAMPFPAILVATLSIGLHVDDARRAAPAVVLAIATMPILDQLHYFSGESDPAGYAILPFFVLGAFGSGRVIRRRARQLQLEQERGDLLAREAVLEERARIARELHDVVAHSVSIIAVQAGAAEQMLDRDPALVREHLAAVRSTAREAMTEMRRLTGVLREHDGSLEPQPGLHRVGELVAASGLPVTVEVSGDPSGLAAGVDLAAFRIVQEALTNVRKHAGPAPTTLRLEYGADAVAVQIVNAAGKPAEPPAPGGRGLPGMRERARIYGGTVEAGPDAGGGFAVRALLPREASAR